MELQIRPQAPADRPAVREVITQAFGDGGHVADLAEASRGIGTRLLLHAIEAAADLGAPMLFLEGDPAYYSRRGWRSAADLGFTPPSNRIPLPAFHVVTLKTYDPAAMTGALIYNDTFWSYDSVGLRP